MRAIVVVVISSASAADAGGPRYIDLSCPHKEFLEIVYSVTLESVNGRTPRGGPIDFRDSVEGEQILLIRLDEFSVSGRLASAVNLYFTPHALDRIGRLELDRSRPLASEAGSGGDNDPHAGDQVVYGSDWEVERRVEHEVRAWGDRVLGLVPQRFAAHRHAIEFVPLDMPLERAASEVAGWLGCDPPAD